MAKAKKWAVLKGKYAETPLGRMTEASNPSHLQKVDKKKAELAEKTEQELMARFVEVQDELKALGERESDLKAELEAADRLIKGLFEGRGLDSARNAELGKTFYLSIEPYISINNTEDLEAYVEQRPELEYLWGVQWGKASTLVKDMLEDGRDEDIPKCFTIFLKTSVRAVKS